MKKIFFLIIRIVIILACLSFFWVHLTYATRDGLANTRKNLAGFYALEENTVDVAIIGTSTTFSSFMPMELWKNYGIVSYDFCTNTMLEDVMPYAVKEVMKTQTPRLIVVDLSPFVFGHYSKAESTDEQVLRCNTDGYRLSKNRNEIIRKIIPKMEERIYYYFDLLYYHKNGAIDWSFWNWKKKFSNMGYGNLGAVFSRTAPLEEFPTEDCEYSEMELNYLEELILVLNQSDSAVLFSIPPYSLDETASEYHSRALFLENYVVATGHRVLNLYENKERIGLCEDEDYALDCMHFNILGAQKITSFVGRYIQQEYDIPDRRDTKGTDAWVNSEEEWNRYLEECTEDINSKLN